MITPIEKMLDLQYVQRWTTVGTTRESNVATHSFNVAVIAMAIYREIYNKVGYTERDVCSYAIIHDYLEAYSGDISTPVKEAMVESGFCPDKFDYGAPREMLPESGMPKAIVKMADLIDNWNFIRQHNSGTRGARAVQFAEDKLHEAVQNSCEDLQDATRKVIDRILERPFDDPEKRRQAKRQAEEAVRIKEEFAGVAELGGEPQHVPGDS